MDLNINKFMDKEDLLEYVRELSDKGKTVYSISRLNSFNDCQYAYYRTYVLKDRGKNSVYGILGGILHEYLENVTNDECTLEEMREKVPDEIKLTRVFNTFPTQSIGDTWEKDVNLFVQNFEKLEDEVITEQGFIIEIGGELVQGYIDIMCLDGNKTYILDWKTSSMFTKDKLMKAGRQLVLYKMAIEKITGKSIDEVAWYMLKYVTVEYDGKQKHVQRSKLIKDLSGLIRTQLKKMCYPPNDIEEMIEKGIEYNTFDVFPQEVKDRFTTKPCIITYNVTGELKDELEEYIAITTHQIESLDRRDSQAWKCKNINEDKGRFCNTLCSHSENCKLLQWWNDKQINK